MNEQTDWDFKSEKKALGRSFLMRALAAVVAIHVVGLGAFLMVQGCATNNSQSGWEDLNTMPKEVAPPPMPHMPPSAPRRVAPAKTTPSYTPAVKLPTAGGTYTVQKGDTLSGIASKYGVTWKTLAAMNGIDDPKKLRVGQTLSVPASSGTVSAAKKSAPVKKALPAGATYTVQSGDTLSGIASRNKVNVADLKAANGLSGDRIIAGQKLVIPGVSAPVQPKVEAPTPAPAAAPVPAAPMAPTPAAPVAPAVAAPTEPVAGVEAPAPEEAPSVRVKAIIVYSGDTLDSIAAQYYTTVEKLNELNKFQGPVELRPGQRIYVPISE